MKFKIADKFSQNDGFLMRHCGYFPIHDRKSNADSFVRKLSAQRYPRFHLYLSRIKNEVVFDLHLDQNVNLYENQTAHNADYDSAEVKQELARIYQIIKAFITF